MKQKIILLLALVPFLTLLSAGLALKELSKPLELPEPKKVEVVYGDSVYTIAAKLQKEGVLRYPKLWVWYARLFDMAKKVKAGEYAIAPGTSALLVLDDMVKGKVVQYAVTLVEGWTTAQALAALHQAPGIAQALPAGDDATLLKTIGADKHYIHSEGLFYPDTYHYIKGTKDWEILKQAYTRMHSTLMAEWEKRAENLPYKSPYEALIMASIIERETSAPVEREQIAGVFVARLQKGMRLQTDPTVIYGMGEHYQGNITRKDLLTPTPYNTYTNNGLPPTPIALPTEASIQAALHPLLNGMLYFVGKGNGYHHFSKTLEEHNAAVHQYQLNRTDGYRSTPALVEEQ